jgi:catechol 2,3-dioxygenase-like lactoylglutathione lyase family enzyme
MATKFWHVGLSVDDLDKAIEQYEKLDLKVVDKFEKDQPHALVALLIGPNGTGIEAWQWLDKSDPQS